MALYLAAILTFFSVPAALLSLSMIFDRAASGRSIRPGIAAVALAALASAVLLLVPGRVEYQQVPGSVQLIEIRRSALEQDGIWGVARGSIPVAAAAAPVLLQLALGTRRQTAPTRLITAAAFVASLVFLILLMFYLSASLAGFLYLPSIAALGAAARRAWSPAADAATLAKRRTAALTWVVPALLLLVPIAAATLWLVSLPGGSGDRIERRGDVEVRSTPRSSP